MLNSRNIFIIFMLIFGLIMAGVALSVHESQASEPARQPLKVALLPILDAFPFYVAQEHGYFKMEGIKVEAIPTASALERDQLMQSGQIDGMLSEMTAAAVFNREKTQVKIVGVLREAYPDSPLFRILAAPNSGIESVSDLAGVPIGISKNTIIEYVTDRLLAEKGLTGDKVVKKSIPVIPERCQLLLQGRIKAATLPDPLAKSAIKAGAKEIISDSAYPRYAISVFIFNLNAIENKQESIRRFLRAWDKAVERIRQEPDALVPLLLKKIRVPKNVQQGYRLPRYPFSKVPDSAQWADVMDWMVKKGLLVKPQPYSVSVTTSFLPRR